MARVFERLIISETIKFCDKDRQALSPKTEALKYFLDPRYGRWRCPIEIDLWSSDRREISSGAGSNQDATREFRNVGSVKSFLVFSFILPCSLFEISDSKIGCESPIGVVTCPAIGMIGGSTIVFRVPWRRSNASHRLVNRQNE